MVRDWTGHSQRAIAIAVSEQVAKPGRPRLSREGHIAFKRNRLRASNPPFLEPRYRAIASTGREERVLSHSVSRRVVAAVRRGYVAMTERTSARVLLCAERVLQKTHSYRDPSLLRDRVLAQLLGSEERIAVNPNYLDHTQEGHLSASDRQNVVYTIAAVSQRILTKKSRK